MTNFLYKGSDKITYWNPSSGGLMVIDRDKTNKMDFLIGRRYIKLLIADGWSTNKEDNVNVVVNSPITNVFVPLSTQQWVDVEKNDGKYSYVRIRGGPTIKIVLIDSPVTLYKDQVDFSKQLQARERERSRLLNWSNNLEYRDGQTPIGASGPSGYVDSVMKQRYNLNAEMHNCKMQMERFERDSENLDRQIQNEQSKSAYHHPKQVKAYFTGNKENDVMVWKVLK